MPYILKDLVVDRVDLVDEGANSAAFIELYKRKENSMTVEEILKQMKPEHAEVIQNAFGAKDAELAKAKEDLEKSNEACKKSEDDLKEKEAELEEEKKKKEDEACSKGSASFDETETFKSMPDNMKEAFLKMRAQKDAAEEQVRKAAEEKAEAEAIAKAASLKAIPVDQDRLVGILKSATPEIVSLLDSINTAIEATVLDEVGKSVGNGAKVNSEDAWQQLEAKAAEIAKRDSVTVEKAMSTALSENPELYKKYLNGGEN